MPSARIHSIIHSPEQQNCFAATHPPYAYLTSLKEITNRFGAKRVAAGARRTRRRSPGSRNESKSEKLAQGPGQAFPVNAAKAQFRAVQQLDNVVTVEQRLQLLDAIQIDQGRAVDAKELGRIETVF